MRFASFLGTATLLASFATLPFGTMACSGSVNGDLGRDSTGSTNEAATVAPIVAQPQIDFAARPSYLPNNSIVLSFDDGPDEVNTAKVLDILKAQKVAATFFVNTQNWSNVDAEPGMQAVLKRIVAEGHELGNHTVHHAHLGTLDAAGVEAEIAGVETTVKTIFGANAPAMTLFRAPYGEPYEANDPANPSAAYNLVAPIVARHAVNVGWAGDEFDYNCTEGDGDCVFANFTKVVATPGKGAYGVILLHSVHPQTVAALPRIIDYVRKNGFVFKKTEDVVVARYGKSSAALVKDARSLPVTTPPTTTPDAGADAGKPATPVTGKGVTTDEPGNCPAGTAVGTACAWPEANGNFQDGYTCQGTASPLRCTAP